MHAPYHTGVSCRPESSINTRPLEPEAVSLEGVVDGRGALQGPPKVMRDASARLTEPRLKSEANALAALSACLPRGGARAGRYELAFPATR